MDYSQYIPGVCNIGPAETAMRKRAGWAGAIVTAVLWGVFACLKVNGLWYVLLFFPAASSASGFIQAKMHFCAAFGLKSLFNFGPVVGKTDSVLQAEFRALDRKKAWRILGYSSLVGLLVALVAYFLEQRVL
jgi:hypothetical protein